MWSKAGASVAEQRQDLTVASTFMFSGQPPSQNFHPWSHEYQESSTRGRQHEV